MADLWAGLALAGGHGLVGGRSGCFGRANGEPALWAGLLFVIYPAFQQQSIGLLYSHFFIVITAFLASLACSLLAIRKPAWRAACLVAGLLLSAANLLMMEYFFLLELLRPLLLFLVLDEQPPVPRKPACAKRCWPGRLTWLLFLGAVFWRVVLFPYQTSNYQPGHAQPVRRPAPVDPFDIWRSECSKKSGSRPGRPGSTLSNPRRADAIGEVNVVRYLLLMIGTRAGAVPGRAAAGVPPPAVQPGSA